jgi:hypothetical protein
VTLDEPVPGLWRLVAVWLHGAFLEGDPIYPGAGFSREAHVRIAVRNPAGILGVFLPNC